MDPAQLLAACHLQITDSVADFGAGSGFVARAAAAIATQGNVFAIEINRDIVARLIRETEETKTTNIHPLWGDIEVSGGSKLKESSMDVVILSNVLFHLDDKQGAFKEASRVLKDGGRLIVVDWTDAFGGMGPRPEAVFSKSAAEELAMRTGFTKLSDNLPAGDHHYAILFKK